MAEDFLNRLVGCQSTVSPFQFQYQKRTHLGINTCEVYVRHLLIGNSYYELVFSEAFVGDAHSVLVWVHKVDAGDVKG